MIQHWQKDKWNIRNTIGTGRSSGNQWDKYAEKIQPVLRFYIDFTSSFEGNSVQHIGFLSSEIFKLKIIYKY